MNEAEPQQSARHVLKNALFGERYGRNTMPETVHILFDHAGEEDNGDTILFEERNEDRVPLMTQVEMRRSLFDRLGAPQTIDLAVTAVV